MSIKNIVLTGFAIAAFGATAMAQAPQGMGQKSGEPGRRGRMDGERRGAGMMGGRMGMSFEKLNLTDAQKQKIQAIQDSASSAREANKSQFEEFGKLMRLKREGLLTNEQGTRLTALQVQMQTQMKSSMDKMQADILAVLTPDQRTLLEQSRMQGPGGERGGMRGGQRPGQPMPNGACRRLRGFSKPTGSGFLPCLNKRVMAPNHLCLAFVPGIDGYRAS